ncbi:MAG: AzlC family ABC transporter permease [Pseudomonadota bacterium]
MAQRRSEFTEGVLSAGAPILAAAPFGALFGALAVDNGMSVFEATLMSAIVFAGASQMVGIELFGEQISPWLIVFSIFAVNFRHVLYSAVTGRRMADFQPWQRYASFYFLVDPHFAESEKRAEGGKPITFAWFLGGGLAWWFLWVLVTFLGALFGGLIENPEQYGVDMLLPIYFLSLVLAFRKRANWLPVVAASAIVSILAFHFIGSPWHVSLGGLSGVLVAAMLGLPKNHRMVV